MKIQEVLTKTTQFFKDKKIESARLDAELLIAKALGLRRIDLYVKFEQPLKDNEVVLCREFVRRRVSGEPVAYILNEKGFYGLDFFVDARVLIPRPESEMLVELALDHLQKLRPKVRKMNKSAMPSTTKAPTDSALDGQDMDTTTEFAPELHSQPIVNGDIPEVFHILDLGCGSGCLGLAMLSQRADVRATLVDRSELALQVAQLNAEKLNLADRCSWQLARVQELQFADTADVILANPPYVRKGDPQLQKTVELFEPALALFGGDSGLEEIEQWLPQCFKALKSGGLLLMEIGADQGPAVLQKFRDSGFQNCELKTDLSGLDRIVCGQKE